MEEDGQDSKRVTQDGGVEGKAVKWHGERAAEGSRRTIWEQAISWGKGDKSLQWRENLFILSSHAKQTRAHPVDKAQAW